MVSSPTVAVVGIGRMGGAMARTLSRAGLELVLWNRDGAKAEKVAEELGCDVAADAAAAASTADVIISSLADDRALEEVYLGSGGLVEGVRPGSVVVDTSTVDPGTVKKVGRAVDEAGAGFLDCPVSGSVSTVEAGSLTIMAGGDPDLVERVRPVLEPLSSRIIHVGGRGSGAAAKLAVNALVHGLNVALSESLVLAEKAGVERKTAYEVFASGAAGAPFVHYKREAYEHPDDAPVAFSLELVGKDLELITGLARRVGVSMRQAETELDIVHRAISAGLGDADLSAVAVFLREEED